MISLLNKKFPHIRENVTLASYTSFNIGGPAKYFLEVTEDEQIIHGVNLAQEHGMNYFILGGGTNLLVSDNGFDGLVLYMKNKELTFKDDTVIAHSGVVVSEMLNIFKTRGLGGLEFLMGIPGSVGGAVRGNAGAYGKSLGDKGNGVLDVEVLKDGKIIRYNRDQMQFSYRTSKVKLEGGVILRTKLHMYPRDPKEIEKDMLNNLQYRNKKTPSNVFSAGSVFKNIEIEKYKIDTERVIKALDITKDEYNEATKYKKLPVSFIVDRLNMKGIKIGNAQISTMHGGYIINIGNAKSDHVIQLIALIKTRVRNLLGIQLEEEIQYVGF